MARITEQAIAEIEIDDKKAAERLKNLAATAERLKQELSGIGKDDKAGFAQKAKEISLVEKEMKKTFDQAVNVQKILKNLNGTSFNDLQKAQKSLTAQFKAGKISAEEYQRQIIPINRRLQELQQITRSGVTQQQSLWSSMIGAVGKFAAGLGIGKLAMDGFNRTMQATDVLSDKFNVAMALGKAAVDSFFRTVATGDWSNLITNMNTAARAAREYTEAMDLIEDRQRSVNLLTRSNRRDANLAALDAADQTKPVEERRQALEKSLDLLKQNLELTKRIREEVAATEVERVSQEFGVQKEFIRDIITNYDEYSRVQEGADKSRFDYAKQILDMEKERAGIDEYFKMTTCIFS